MLSERSIFQRDMACKSWSKCSVPSLFATPTSLSTQSIGWKKRGFPREMQMKVLESKRSRSGLLPPMTTTKPKKIIWHLKTQVRLPPWMLWYHYYSLYSLKLEETQGPRKKRRKTGKPHCWPTLNLLSRNRCSSWHQRSIHHQLQA